MDCVTLPPIKHHKPPKTIPHFPSFLSISLQYPSIPLFPPPIQFPATSVLISDRQMDRKDYTPTKSSKLLTPAPTNYSLSREPLRPNSELALTREYESLRLQARQLEIQNRQLATEVDKLRYERNLHESKLLQKATFEEQAMNQYQKEKNYQLDMLKIKNEEELARFRREQELRVEDLQRESKTREQLNRDLADKQNYLESRNQELRRTLEGLETELIRFRDSNSNLTEQLTRQQFANKKLQMLAEELDRQKSEMQNEIHILLDIEADKSRALHSLSLQLDQSEQSEQQLKGKLELLTNNFAALEEHIALMRDRLGNAEMRGEDVEKQLQRVEYQIADKEQLIAEQRDRQIQVRAEIEGHIDRERRRLAQVAQLMEENQGVYREIANTRRKLYEVSIEQEIDI